MNNLRAKTNNGNKAITKSSRKQLVERLIAGMIGMRHSDRDASRANILQKHGFSSPQIPIMILIEKAGGVSIKCVAKQLNITSSAATQLVQTLIRHGILRKTTDNQDHRAVRIEFSPSGKRAFGALHADMLGEIEQTFKPVPDRELSEMVAIFEKVLGYIKKESH
jgi:DNA-binding MarR family transcriptional regulator